MPGMGGPMNRGGAAMPGMGGGGMGGGGMGGGGGDAAQMMDMMYRPSYNRPTYGLGPEPGPMSASMMRLQKECSGGNGQACAQLKVATKQHEWTRQKYAQDLAYAEQQARGRTSNSMTAR